MENNTMDLTHLISTPDAETTTQPKDSYLDSIDYANNTKPDGFLKYVQEDTSASTEDLWNYHNMVNAVEPDHRKHTGTNQTPAKKLERKKRKARKTQRASRKANRKH